MFNFLFFSALKKSFLVVIILASFIGAIFFRNQPAFTFYTRAMRRASDIVFPSNTRNAAEFNLEFKRTHVGREEVAKRLPNVFLIGSPKCGTDAILSFLDLHPSIVSRTSTTLYFGANYDKDLEWYRQQMLPSQDGQIVIEKGLGYMHSELALDRIYRYNSSVKLLMILREPVERTLSWYGEYVSLGRARNETLQTFEDIILMPGGEELNTSSKPIRRGRFSEYVTKCYNRFPKKQIFIIDGEKFVSDPYVELKKVESFLNLDNFYTRDTFVFNKDKGFYCTVLADNKIKCKAESKGRKHIEIAADLREKLKRYFETWNQKLRQITGMNFSWITSS